MRYYDKKAIAFFRYLKSTGQSFTMSVSNYTMSIDVDGIDQPYKFIKESKTPKFFAAMRMIEKDVEFAVETMGFSNHLLDESIDPKFYTCAYNLVPFSAPEIFNIDLDSAYPTALLQLGLISKETFEYLMTIPKIDRLAAVGCLAKSKNIYHYENGKLEDFETETSQYKNIWRVMVNLVDKLLNELIEIDPENFVFYWVDGIFFREQPSPEKLEQMKVYIEETGFNFKHEKIENFELRRAGEKIFVEFDRAKPNKPSKHIEQSFADPHFMGLRNYISRFIN